MSLVANEIQNNNFLQNNINYITHEYEHENSEKSKIKENQINYIIYLFTLHKIFISFEKKTFYL